MTCFKSPPTLVVVNALHLHSSEGAEDLSMCSPAIPLYSLGKYLLQLFDLFLNGCLLSQDCVLKVLYIFWIKIIYKIGHLYILSLSCILSLFTVPFKEKFYFTKFSIYQHNFSGYFLFYKSGY